MMKYRKIDYFFDYGAIESCLWGYTTHDNGKTSRKLITKPDELGLSDKTLSTMKELTDWFQDSLDWNDGMFLWRQEECDRFIRAANELFEMVKNDLGNEIELINVHGEMHENPDLDLYMNDLDAYYRKTGRTVRKDNQEK